MEESHERSDFRESTRHDLTITPQGHLRVRDVPTNAANRSMPTRLIDAYLASPAQGMLVSATRENAVLMPASLEFTRSIAQLYLASLCRAVLAEGCQDVPDIPPPSSDLQRAIVQAPPITGLEYLTLDVLNQWCVILMNLSALK